MSSVLLDASAVLAVLHQEPGGEQVAEVLHGATMSAVNYGEVLKKTIEFQGSATKVELFLAHQRLVIVPFDQRQAKRAAEIYPVTKHLGFSMADRACLALGLELGIPVWTAERKFVDCGLSVAIELIRGR